MSAEAHEEWRRIPSFPDYMVSSLGRVASHKYRTPRLLQPVIHKSGYPRFGLYVGRKRIRKASHALVAEAFIGPRPDGMVIRHLDGDPSNNTPGNLAYGTNSENVVDQIRHGTHPQARKTHCKFDHPLDGRLSDGTRYCKACRLAKSRRYSEKRRLQRLGVAA